MENESVVYETQPDDIISIEDDNGPSEGVDAGSSSQTPLKRYVSFLPVEKGKSAKWYCSFRCKNDPYTGSYSRIRAHLIGLLPGQRAQGISKMKKEELDAQKVGGGKKTSISIIPTITQSSSSSLTGKRGIVGMFDTSSRSDVDAVIKTRFGSHYVMLERIVRVKRHLINMVLSEEWGKIKKGWSKQNTDSDHVRKTVLDEDFWESAKFVLSFTKPIWLMIRFCDSDKSVIGVVYPKMRIMLEKIKAVLADNAGICEAMEKLVISRWEMMNRPLHSLAYVLNPYFHSQAWLKGDQGRKPHADPYVAAVYLGTVDKMVRDPAERLIVRQQIGDFLSSKGPFARPQAIADQEYMSATTWWGMYGLTTVELHSLAVKILAQSVNSSCAERAWSTYSYIHNVKRNNLNASRAESLVFIHYNQRLLSRYRNDYEDGYKDWDIFANNDNLDFDNEGVEDREYRELFSVDDTSLEPSASQAQGSSRDAEEVRRQEITRGKRSYPG
ncbi:hypothetical protein ACHQM5_004494 [Ranunculus cassubicifolius]